MLSIDSFGHKEDMIAGLGCPYLARDARFEIEQLRGEQFKFEEIPQSPESLATRDFSASGHSWSTNDWDSKFDDSDQVDDVESALKEALSLNNEEARALLGRLEYQRGNFDAALHVFQGITVQSLAPKMTAAIEERTRQKRGGRSKGEITAAPVMPMHSVSLLL